MCLQVAWHDLAFFDPAMYESLRKLIVDSQGQGGSDRLASMGLTFQVSRGRGRGGGGEGRREGRGREGREGRGGEGEGGKGGGGGEGRGGGDGAIANVTVCLSARLQVSLRAEEGAGDSCELVVGGASEPVTPDNVYQYVKLYAELRMVQVCQDALQVSRCRHSTTCVVSSSLLPLPPQALRQGVYDVIPEGSLSSLSVEDLRLVLCGCHTIDTERLRTATVFEDESSESLHSVYMYHSTTTPGLCSIFY